MQLPQLPSKQQLLLFWHSVAAVFSAGWFYFPCVALVLGTATTLVSIAFAALIACIGMLCLLVVRRRRALVLQGWRRGFVAKRDATGSRNNNNNPNSNSNNKTPTISAATIAQIESGNVSLSELVPGEQAWPSGAARMFEGSDVFHCDLTTEEMWRFCFGLKHDDNSNKNSRRYTWDAFTNDPLAVTRAFVTENLWTMLCDITEFTSLLFDGFQGFAALSVLCLVLVGALTAAEIEFLGAARQQHGDEGHMLHKYFPSSAHIAVAVVLAVGFFAAARFLDVNRLKLVMLVAVIALTLFVGVRDSFFYPLVSPSSRHFPSRKSIFKMFYKAPKDKRFDDLESDAIVPFRLAKRPLANPTALLLTAKTTTTNSSSNNNEPKIIHLDDDEQDEHFEIGDYVPLFRQWIVYAFCMLFAFFSEGAGVKRNPLPTDLNNPLLEPRKLLLIGNNGIQQQQQVAANAAAAAQTGGGFAPAVLMKDSVTHFQGAYSKLIFMRAIAVAVFAIAATWVSPMMTWEMSYGSWLGVVYVKAKQQMSSYSRNLSFIDVALVVVLLAWTSFNVTQTLVRFLARLRHPTSLYVSYPWLRNVLVLLVAVMLASNEQTFMMSAAAVRGRGERDVEDLLKKQPQQEEEMLKSNAATGGGSRIGAASQFLASFASSLLLGKNPWLVASKLHFLCGGIKNLVVPLMMFAESEAALKRLGFPTSMISIHESTVLDNGRAKTLGIVLAAAWSFFVIWLL